MKTICLNEQQTDFLKELLIEQVTERSELSQKSAMIIDQICVKLMEDFEEPEGYPNSFISEQEQSLTDKITEVLK